MNETERIRGLIEEYKALFEITNMDIAESMKGLWFFIRYDKENDCYEVLAHFSTAEELAEIMLGELASDIFTSIDCVPEDPSYHNLADDIEVKEHYQKHINRLLEYLNK